MKYIKITNKGEIDLNAFLLMGASTKRDQDKIGFFGSGLKYAIAVLIRNNVGLRIFSGVKEIVVSVKERQFRDKTFRQICFDGQETSLTAEIGVDWEPWFPIREVYCNALDEGDCEIDVVDEAVPDFDKTSFFIEMNEAIREVFDNWDKYFTNKRRDIAMIHDDVKIYEGGEDYIIYRKGVACHHERRKSLFHYDVNQIEINESRTLKHSVDNTWRIAEVLCAYANPAIINRIYSDCTSDHIEWYMRWENGTFNDDWLKCINGKRLIKHEIAGHYIKEFAKGDCIVLPGYLVRSLKKRFGKDIVVVGDVAEESGVTLLEMTEKQAGYIKDACEFLKNAGYDIDYPVKVCIFDDSSILGAALGGKILISPEAFNDGKKRVVETIFEEYLHLKYGVSDCSREMQNLLFGKIVGLMEEKLNVYF